MCLWYIIILRILSRKIPSDAGNNNMSLTSRLVFTGKRDSGKFLTSCRVMCQAKNDRKTIHEEHEEILCNSFLCYIYSSWSDWVTVILLPTWNSCQVTLTRVEGVISSHSPESSAWSVLIVFVLHLLFSMLMTLEEFMDGYNRTYPVYYKYYYYIILLTFSARLQNFTSDDNDHNKRPTVWRWSMRESRV